MKRHFYTLLLATALSLPAAGAFATGLSGSSSGSASSIGSTDSTGALGDTTVDTRSDVGANADIGAESNIGADRETGVGYGEDLDRRAETGIGTETRTDAEVSVNQNNTTLGDTTFGANNATRPGSPGTTGPGGLTDRTNTMENPTGTTRLGTGTTGMGQRAEANSQLDLQNRLNQDNDQILAPQELSSREVRGVQSILENRGYYQGNIDGLWGPKTAQALQSFQSDYDLERTGQLDAQTVNRLSMAAGSSNSQARTQGQTGSQMDGSVR